MTSKIDLAEKRKIVDFKRSIKEQLDTFKEERVLLERNEFYNNLIDSKDQLKEDYTDDSYDDESEVIDYEDVDADLEADILKEFEKELGE